jgi:HEAT repeats
MRRIKGVVGLCSLAILWWSSTIPLPGQTIERDTAITGPRGRTVERQVEIQRRPGAVERSIQIKRPGGTFERQVQVERLGGVPRRGPMTAGPWPRPPWIPRTIVVSQPAPAFGFGLLAAPMLNFSFGAGGSGIGWGPVVPFGGPGPAGPPGVAPPPDEVALMTQRLQSFYSNNRREAAYKLGQFGDPRAVPSLIHVLKYDLHKDVRIASAIALGEIGGNDSAIALERSSIYDHKDDVRRACATALERLNAKAMAAAASVPQMARPRGVPRPPEPTTTFPFRRNAETVKEPRQAHGNTSDALPAQDDPEVNQPPPPPTPVTGSPSGDNR